MNGKQRANDLEEVVWKGRVNFRTFEMTEHETNLSYFFKIFFLTIGLLQILLGG